MTKIIAASAVLTLALSASADVRYTITDLGTLGNFSATAKGISQNGLIVGAANTPATGYDFAVRWGNGGGQVLTGEGASGASANAVNNSGVVVGVTDSLALNGFVLDSTGLHQLPTPGAFGGSGCDINDAGLIVGGMQNHEFYRHAATWRLVNGAYVMTPLPELGGLTSVALAVNAQGVIVGSAEQSNHLNVPCIWTVTGVQPLAIETSSIAEALGINDANQVVGYSYTNTGGAAFFWSEATGEVDMGTLGNAYSTARAINNHGVAVGQSYVAGTSAIQHAFVWQLGGVMTDLNTLITPGSGWELWDAQDINDGGKIVGGGIKNGHAHAFLLTPIVCLADMGGPGGVAGADGALDNNDFIAFINRFFAQDAEADIGSAGGVAGVDGAWDNNDFIVFIDRFFAGC